MRFSHGLFIGLLGVASPAYAVDIGALVLDVAGEVEPGLDLFDEVVVGTELRLGAESEMTLSHYGACDEISIRGGTVIIGKSDVKITGGSELARIKVDCPEPVALIETDSTNASVIMRNFGRVPAVPLIPDIVVAGASAKKIETLTIMRDDKEVATLPVKAGTIEWPAGNLFLSHQTKYTLVLTGDGIDHRAVVVADKESGGRVVLRP
jgi:hypothetical protein